MLERLTELFGSLFEADAPTVARVDNIAPIMTLCSNATLRIDLPLFPGAPHLDEQWAFEQVARLNGDRALVRAQMFYSLSPSGALLLSSLTHLQGPDCEPLILQRLGSLCAQASGARIALLAALDAHATATNTPALFQQFPRALRG
ncbi:hypothetical protein [Pseudomonas entomophila]|uniref:hypothetical protein n=1 Tax=Pseudomonas entomophila TaxID=312306 RepID=UPI001EFFAB3B|nr:hypothetical protein [Pseudomonas entomophila]MCG8291441.1 hypothetical protein [Pseudomonas entomophila]